MLQTSELRENLNHTRARDVYKRQHFDKAGASYKRYLKEINLGEEETELKAGEKITVDIFEEGQLVDIVAISKGKGTQGAIKRWNYGRGPASHGSKSHRVAGARACLLYTSRCV